MPEFQPSDDVAAPIPAAPLDSLHALAAESAEMPHRFVRKLHVADFAPRAFATMADFVVLFVVAALSAFTIENVGVRIGSFPVFYLALAVLWWLLALFDVYFGGTPGKHMLSLRIRDLNGRAPSPKGLLIRLLVRRPMLLTFTFWAVTSAAQAALDPTKTNAGEFNGVLIAIGGFVQLSVYILSFSGEGPHDLLSRTRLFEQSELTIVAITSNVRLDGEAEGHAFTVIPSAGFHAEDADD